MLEAGVHFGHQTQRWNPKMKPYIFGARNGIYIIDLQKTHELYLKAHRFLSDLTARGEKVLFVGTKNQAQEIVMEQAKRAGQFFVTQRWLGGILTNFKTIKQSLERYRTIEKMATDGTFEKLTKKEVLNLEREKFKLEKNLGGIKEMSSLPSALFVIDPGIEHIAIAEAKKLGIPVIALIDTNCNPDDIDFVVPGNDDAIRSIKLFVSSMADACVDGNNHYMKTLEAERAEEKDGKKSSRSSQAQEEMPETLAESERKDADHKRGGPRVEKLSRVRT